MPAVDIPDPLPPAITPDREVIEFHPRDAVPAPAATEEGSVTITLREACGP